MSTLSGRVLATFPAAVVVLIINEQEELLLLNHPTRPGLWEPVNGAMDAHETVLEAALREVQEEAGREIRVRPLGVAHVSTFTYDANVTHFIGITYLMAYEGGEVIPGDDMQGSQILWWPLANWENNPRQLIPPLDQPWLLERVKELYRLWYNRPPVPLQRPLGQTRNKYEMPEARENVSAGEKLGE